MTEVWARRHRINPDDIEQLAAFVDAGEDLAAVWRAVLRLQKIGTVAAVPALKKAVYYAKSDIKIAALYAIARIEEARGGPYYIAMLGDPRYPEKGAAVDLIARYCGPEGVPAMAKRVVTILARGRRRIAWFANFTKTELTIPSSTLSGRGVARPQQSRLSRWSGRNGRT